MSDNSWFAGNHGPEGVWNSAKGSMLAPHIAGPWTGGVPTMVQVDTTSNPGTWTSNTIVNTGMTGGGGTMAR